MADDVAGGVARDGGLGVGGLQDFGGVIVEDGTKEIGEGGAVFGVVAEECAARPDQAILFGGGIGDEQRFSRRMAIMSAAGVGIFLDGMVG